MSNGLGTDAANIEQLVSDATMEDRRTSGRMSLRTSSPLVFDTYRSNRRTGSFILIDTATDATVGAGMIS